MKYNEIIQKLPNTQNKVVVVLSGGLDSSVATIILNEYYGRENVVAISFNYGQKQAIELVKARKLCSILGINHKILNLSILGDVVGSASSNIKGSTQEVPLAREVENDVQPITYVPNRNMVMYAIAASQAEVIGSNYIFCGLQVHDLYGYYDTTQEWVDCMNKTLGLNRRHKIQIMAPFSALSKYDEIKILEDMGKLNLLKHTITCYNPDEHGRSCGRCPSCAERLMNFAKAGIIDPIEYIENKIKMEKFIC